MQFGCLVSGSSPIQLLVQYTTWLLKRVSVHLLRKSKFLLYILYYTENTYPKTEYFEFTTVQKKK